jgi:hypothetical protein
MAIGFVQLLDGHGVRPRLQQELNGAWIGSLRRDHMRAVLGRFAW